MVRENSKLPRDKKRFLKLEALRGVELVDSVTRLCAMNLLLHGIGPSAGEAPPPVRTDDALRADPGERFQVVLTNRPFGKKSSGLVVNAEGEEERQALTVVRDDFWVSTTTTNKQLNFVQHVKTLLPHRWPGGGGGGGAGQCPLRGRRRRDGPAQAPSRV
jgi:type I restriction enzyme M protein